MDDRIHDGRSFRALLDGLGADGPEGVRRRRVVAGALVAVALLGPNVWGRAGVGTWFEVWIGVEDTLESAALIVTAIFLARRSRSVAWAGGVSLVLMLLGALFQVMMAASGDNASYTALPMSLLLIKLPTVWVLSVLVRRGRQW
ncbi:hypothetical protein ACIRST_40600 [Kitasatospora sp. NPDC101447]|uniref:hypothetical protein n=1 Tax=Kitasatospora sp. NPDC101447 TaxID=3364102 RepID=UPI0037F4EB2D